MASMPCGKKLGDGVRLAERLGRDEDAFVAEVHALEYRSNWYPHYRRKPVSSFFFALRALDSGLRRNDALKPEYRVNRIGRDCPGLFLQMQRKRWITRRRSEVELVLERPVRWKAAGRCCAQWRDALERLRLAWLAQGAERDPVLSSGIAGRSLWVSGPLLAPTDGLLVSGLKAGSTEPNHFFDPQKFCVHTVSTDSGRTLPGCPDTWKGLSAVLVGGRRPSIPRGGRGLSYASPWIFSSGSVSTPV